MYGLLSTHWRGAVVVAVLILLTGCATRAPQADGQVLQLRQQIQQRLPDRLDDRAGWAADIQTAFHAQGIPGTTENICATLAVIA